jgi:enoyl-CoA hydratase
MTDEPPVIVERRGRVQLITFNRPEARNAFTLEMAQLVAAALDELDADDDLAAAVVTGAGGCFSAGMDLKAFARGEVPAVPVRGFAGMTQYASRKPIIAAIEGPALAGGFELAVAEDSTSACRRSHAASSPSRARCSNCPSDCLAASSRRSR